MAAKFRVTYKLTDAETEFITTISAKVDLPEEALHALQQDKLKINTKNTSKKEAVSQDPPILCLREE